MDLFSALGIGIFSGIVATACWFFFQMLWLDKVVPWHERRIYKDVILAEIWNCTVTLNGVEWDGTLKLCQNAHKISGVGSYTVGGVKGMSYKLQGELRNRILTLTYEASNIHSLDRGTLTLMIQENGTCLRGHMAYYEDVSDSIKSVPYKFDAEKVF